MAYGQIKPLEIAVAMQQSLKADGPKIGQAKNGTGDIERATDIRRLVDQQSSSGYSLAALNRLTLLQESEVVCMEIGKRHVVKQDTV